jgi:hypothetical protein
MTTSSIRVARIVAAGTALLVFTGCASTDLTQTRKAGVLPEPDRVLVRDFAVTLAEVEMDSGFGPTVWREAEGEVDGSQEQELGRAASRALSEAMVEKLVKAGIPAEHSRGRVSLTPRTLVIAGKFLTMDEGNQTLRVLVGFGAGASQVRTRAQAWMNGELVAEAETTAKSGKKPGAAATLGAGAAAGTVATAAAVTTAMTGATELFATSVEADARRTGEEIADRIIRAYRERGWLPN